MSYQLGYDPCIRPHLNLLCFKCMSYQISKKSYSKDSFFIFLKINNKCVNIKRGRTLIKSYTISFAPNLRHFINNWQLFDIVFLYGGEHLRPRRCKSMGDC